MSNTDASGEKRMTGTSERREQIIQRLRQQGSVQVNDLSALYGVSTVTIRNDLAFQRMCGTNGINPICFTLFVLSHHFCQMFHFPLQFRLLRY